MPLSSVAIGHDVLLEAATGLIKRLKQEKKHGIDRLPPVFRKNRRITVIDARGIGLEECLVPAVHSRHDRRGARFELHQAEREVPLQKCRTALFGKPASSGLSEHLHLPTPLAGVQQPPEIGRAHV